MSQYQHPLTHYAKLYGVAYRTVLRWKERGYPLDNEAECRALVATQKNSPAPKSAPDSHGNTPRTVPAIAPGAMGLSASIQRLQAAESAAHADYITALEAGEEAVATNRRKEWLAFSEQLRRVEQSAPDIAEQNKSLIKADEVSSALSELFITLRQDLENLGKRVAQELVGKDELAIREIINRETALLIESLYACKYLGAEDDEG